MVQPLARCDICGSNVNIVGVAGSRLGPMSCSMCRTCLNEDAEMEGMFDYTAGECGSNVHDGIFNLKTFKDGKYITYREYLQTWKPEVQTS